MKFLIPLFLIHILPSFVFAHNICTTTAEMDTLIHGLGTQVPRPITRTPPVESLYRGIDPEDFPDHISQNATVLQQKIVEFQTEFAALTRTGQTPDPQRLSQLTTEIQNYTAAHNRICRQTGDCLPIIPMQANSITYDVEHNIRYLNNAERRAYHIEATDGLVHNSDGQLLTTQADHPATIVMDMNGEIYVNSHNSYLDANSPFRHSSLSGGAPVVFAGEVTIRDGRIIMISNNSGHYRTHASILDQFIRELNERGISTTGTEIVHIR